MIPVYSSNYFENFLDAIPSWSSYPCQCGSVGERVIVSDLEIAIASPSSEHICLFCSFDVRPLSQPPENPRWDFYDRGLHHFPIPLLSHHPDPESGFLTSWHRSTRDSDRFCQVTTEEEQELTISRCERIALGKNQWEPLQRVKLCRIYKEFIVNYQILQGNYLSIYEGLWQDGGCGDGPTCCKGVEEEEEDARGFCHSALHHSSQNHLSLKISPSCLSNLILAPFSWSSPFSYPLPTCSHTSETKSLNSTGCQRKPGKIERI